MDDTNTSSSITSLSVDNTTDVSWLAKEYLYNVTWNGGSISIGNEQLVLTAHTGWGSIANKRLKPGSEIVVRHASGQMSPVEVVSIKYSGQCRVPVRIDFAWDGKEQLVNPIIYDGPILKSRVLSTKQIPFLLTNAPVEKEPSALKTVEERSGTAGAWTALSTCIAFLTLSSHLPPTMQSWILMPCCAVGASAITGGIVCAYYEADNKSRGIDKISAFAFGAWIGTISGSFVAVPIALGTGAYHKLFGASALIVSTAKNPMFQNVAQLVARSRTKLRAINSFAVQGASRPVAKVKAVFCMLKK
ncbi:MAG: hypothetical protein PHW76_05710 [Alphaproteobacteria bacterium]|nr:hypothetical protein [Alphaproteobacteria bacterium]